MVSFTLRLIYSFGTAAVSSVFLWEGMPCISDDPHKHQQICNTQHGITDQKVALFIITDVRSSSVTVPISICEEDLFQSYSEEKGMKYQNCKVEPGLRR